MGGRPGRSGGKNKIDPSLHVLRGTYRAPRHGPELDARQPVWTATDAQLGALGVHGKALVDRLRSTYDLTPWEGELVLEAAVAMDRLGQIRETRDGADLKVRLALDKTEQLWQKQLSGLLLSLRIRP